jgi:hypothetical protein
MQIVKPAAVRVPLAFPDRWRSFPGPGSEACRNAPKNGRTITDHGFSHQNYS